MECRLCQLPGLEERRGRTDKDRMSINIQAMKIIKCSHQNLLRCALSFGPKPRFPEGPTSSTVHISESALLFADRKKSCETRLGSIMQVIAPATCLRTSKLVRIGKERPRKVRTVTHVFCFALPRHFLTRTWYVNAGILRADGTVLS